MLGQINDVYILIVIGRWYDKTLWNTDTSRITCVSVSFCQIIISVSVNAVSQSVSCMCSYFIYKKIETERKWSVEWVYEK